MAYGKAAAKTEKFCVAVIVIIALTFMLYLTCCAYLETADLNTNDPSGEHIDFYSDNFFVNILVSIVVLLVMYLVYRHAEWSIRKAELTLLCVLFVFGTVFIASVKLSAPIYTDSFLVTDAAQRAARGDFSALGDYFCRFPFQLGYVLYSEALIRVMSFVLRGLPEGYYCLALQEINLLWLLLSVHAMLKITDILFHDEGVQRLAMLLMLFCVPAVLACTFLYGNIPAFGAGITAVWMFLEFLRGRRLHHALLCALLLSLAVMLKLNLLIFCVAVAIVWLITLMKRFSIKSLLCLVLTAACVLTLKAVPQRIYERRCGTQFGEGIPMLAWMAMGMSEGYAAPGWYRPDNTVTVFAQSGNDPAATAENAKTVLTERSEVFGNDTAYALKFFSEKLRSMWNEPTYETLWLNRVYFSFSEKAGIYDFICESGVGRTAALMNQHQQTVFLGMLLSLLALLKRKRIENCILPLIILGGLMYHLMFEAKSQYALPYFIMMIPMAAVGFSALFGMIRDR